MDSFKKQTFASEKEKDSKRCSSGAGQTQRSSGIRDGQGLNEQGCGASCRKTIQSGKCDNYTAKSTSPDVGQSFAEIKHQEREQLNWDPATGQITLQDNPSLPLGTGAQNSSRAAENPVVTDMASDGFFWL